MFLPGCDDGHPCVGTVPVPARLGRFGPLGQWQVPGRRLVGCLSGTTVRVMQPLRLIDSGFVQAVLPELDPGARAAGRSPIMHDYFRLYAIILLRKLEQSYAIISLSQKRRLFHLFHYDYFTYYFRNILLRLLQLYTIICIILSQAIICIIYLR